MHNSNPYLLNNFSMSSCLQMQIHGKFSRIQRKSAFSLIIQQPSLTNFCQDNDGWQQVLTNMLAGKPWNHPSSNWNVWYNRRIILLYYKDDYSKILVRIWVVIRPDLLWLYILNLPNVNNLPLNILFYKSWANPSFFQFTILYLWTRIHRASELTKKGVHGLETSRKMAFKYNLHWEEQNDSLCHAKFYEKQTLTHLQDNGHVVIFLVHCCCWSIIQAKETTTSQQRRQHHNKEFNLSQEYCCCLKICHFGRI